MAAVGHFECPKFTLDHISGYFRSKQTFFFKFTKWLPVAILDVRKSLSILFLAISDRYTTLIFFKFFYKMTAVGHFGCPKFTLDHISGHFRSIQICYFLLKFVTKWLPVAILDVRKSLSISFLSISHRYATLIFVEIFDKLADVGHFGCPNFTFDRISGHFISIRNFNFFFNFFDKMADVGHFGCPKFTFDRISDHFRLIGHWISEIHFRSQFWPFQIIWNFIYFLKFLTKWPLATILDVRK